MFLTLLDRSHASELARLIGTTVSNVRKGLDSLEQMGVVSGRYLGRTREVQLNPGYFAYNELRPLLDKLAYADGEVLETATLVRRRPRRAAKDL